MNPFGTILAFLIIHFSLILPVQAQHKDSLADGKVVTLSDVVVRKGMDVQGFIDRVRKDTSFYKAFRNLRVLGFTSLNDIRIFDPSHAVKASLYSRTTQKVAHGCRKTEKISEQINGNFYDDDGGYRYYTAELYAGLFFAWDTICGETNIVNGMQRSLRGKKGLDRHKEQLKMLFFDPGQPIPGIPLMGNKAALFDPTNSELYDFTIDIEEYQGSACYVFDVKARDDLKPSQRDNVVIDGMKTRFDYTSFQVLSRQYRMSYDAGLYHFQVQMEVELAPWGKYLVPHLIRYTGDWGVLFRKKEDAVFTATLFDFEEPK